MNNPSQLKPMEWWMAKDGNGYYDREGLEQVTRIGFEKFHHVVEYSAYQKLESMLVKAEQFLREGKAKFAPNTTNSFVDDWLKDFAEMRKAGL